MSADSIAIVTHPDFTRYDFGPQHPLKPERIVAGLDLLRASGIWQERAETLPSVPATDVELALVHDPAYIRAVDDAGSSGLSYGRGAHYGLTSSDNPPFPDMHYVASLVAGGALHAVRNILDNRLIHAFHPAGGWHHAQRARASGFCIYNDPALAAAAAVQEYGARVLSIDLDCHHGDGVQWLFYDSPDVFTLSFHESGNFLYPGTGNLDETGTGAGSGYSVNVPFAPYSRDDCWQAALDLILEEVTERFRPDLIISNHGCDTHVWDPITHLCCTSASLEHQVRLVHRLAEQYTGGRWLAVGSGGYEWRRVVPRSWAIIWAEMSGRSLPVELPAAWLDTWRDPTDIMPTHFRDDDDIMPGTSRAQEIAAYNVDAMMTAVLSFRDFSSNWS